MKAVGLDIGTNYTKATSDGENVIIFPSLVVYGEKKDWSLKGEEKEVYIGEEAVSFAQNVENVEVLRPLHEGRLIHNSYIELAKYAFLKLNTTADIIATGLPVKSSKKEREEIVRELEEALKKKVVIFPEPAGTLADMGIDTGVCIDIGFGTTDIVVLADMEYLKGDTLLMGVDKIYENVELSIRNKIGISITPEEMTTLLLDENCRVGRIRGGKKVSISHDEIMEEYKENMKVWVERIANRAKILIEGLSLSIVENLVISGGGSLLPGVKEEFERVFEDVGEIKMPKTPLTSNAKGYFKLAKILLEESKDIDVEKGKEDESIKDEKGSLESESLESLESQEKRAKKKR